MNYLGQHVTYAISAAVCKCKCVCVCVQVCLGFIPIPALKRYNQQPKYVNNQLQCIARTSQLRIQINLQIHLYFHPLYKLTALVQAVQKNPFTIQQSILINDDHPQKYKPNIMDARFVLAFFFALFHVYLVGPFS